LWPIGALFSLTVPYTIVGLTRHRGEIAVRILSAARELDYETYALYSDNDATHTYGADHAVKLPSAASYLDIDKLLHIVKEYHIEAVHPGYGFLSESTQFARRLQDDAGVLLIGPGPDALERTGDKLQARALAEECTTLNPECWM